MVASSQLRSRHMVKRVALSVLVWVSVSVAAAPPAKRTTDPVELALRRGTAYLYSVQKGGHWDLPAPGPDAKPDERGNMSLEAIQNSSQGGGVTALATYALRAAGEPPQEPRVAAAIAFLKKAEVKGT